MPDDLKARIAESADANGRSLHAELLLRLNASFRLNKVEADTTRDRLQTAESKLRETILMQRLVHLGNCAMFLLQAIRGPDPKGAIEAYSDLVGISEDAAQQALAYERELSPAMRLEEYRKEIEAAKELLRVWDFQQLPSFGEDLAEDFEPQPLTRTQKREQMEASLEKYMEVIDRKAAPISPKKTNRGPMRSPNARKPKP